MSEKKNKKKIKEEQRSYDRCKENGSHGTMGGEGVQGCRSKEPTVI